MSPETTTIPERVVATITPESVDAPRFRVRCQECTLPKNGWAESDTRDYVDGYAEAHVRRTGHTVEILERMDGPRVGVGDEGVE